MAETRTCLECGSPLQDELAGGLCPRCLMGLGVAAADAETLTASEPEPVSRGSRRSPRFSDGDDLGHFRIVRPLGQGGMGEVYEAEDLDSGRRVAIKVMAHTLVSDEHRERFLREGRLAASINHPNSVQAALDKGILHRDIKPSNCFVEADGLCVRHRRNRRHSGDLDGTEPWRDAPGQRPGRETDGPGSRRPSRHRSGCASWLTRWTTVC